MKKYETPEVKVSAPIAYEDILVGSDDGDTIIETQLLFADEQ